MGSGSSAEALRDKTVVVIGCGDAGKGAAFGLRGKCKLIVIDPRDAMHFAIGALRATVESGFVKKTLIPIRDVFGESFKQGTVKEINPSEKTVTLEDGEKISYDYLVVATGSRSPFPGKFDNNTSTEQATELYENANKKVRAANKIVIIGGGAVGVEMAGEVATDYPDKEVTLIHSREHLLDSSVDPKFIRAAKSQLEGLNVKLVMGEKVTNLKDIPRDLSGATVKTDKGSVIEADLVVVCIGMTVNSESYASSLGNSMDARGYLKVNAYLQVEGHDNIFAAGDCSTAHEMKMIYLAREQGETVMHNILLHEQGKPMKPYKPFYYVFALSIGRNGGVLQIGYFIMGAWAMRLLKSRDMFTTKTWKEWGLTVPA